MAELWTETPALAAVYDVECAGRHDHDFYLELAAAIGAGSVVDVGCGTGVFAGDLADRGHRVIGVDPAAAMLDIARRRCAHDTIEWIHGHAADVASGVADLVVMMGHVAQYFIDDEDWKEVLRQSRRILRPGGRLAFETRNPTIDWAQRWSHRRQTYPHPDGGEFTSWIEVTSIVGTPESYAMTHQGHTLLPDGRHLTAEETLRFRSPGEVLAGLDHVGFEVEATWGDWDRSALTPTSPELIVQARRG